MPTKNNIEEIIRNSLKKSEEQKREYSLFGRVFVYVKDPVLENINVSSILYKIEKIMPPHLMDEVDEILVGSFDRNEDRQLEAHYDSGAIYITSNLPTEEDYVENIVHETAHAIEGHKGLEIYGDRRIEQEFLGKRRRLASTLESHDIGISHLNFEEPDYDPEFDSFLYKQLGYENMTSLTMGLFASPYGATSLREYFANGFEEFFLGDREYLKKISPELFSKLMGVILDDDDI